jgi:hypothetical protein
MDMQQLQQMVLSAHGHTKAKPLMAPFNLWSAACGSRNVRTLLQQPAALLQALQQQRAPSTAATYLLAVFQVLQEPAVAALLPQSELASLLQQLQVAKQQHQAA